MDVLLFDLRNPDKLNSFLKDASVHVNDHGWRAELDVLKRRLGSGNDIEFSKSVLQEDGLLKEVDVLDYSTSELIEIKRWEGSWVSIAKKFLIRLKAKLAKAVKLSPLLEAFVVIHRLIVEST